MLKIRTRLFVGFVVVAGAALFAFVYSFTGDFRPRYLATMEESMVDVANLLAAVVEYQIVGEEPPTENLHAIFELARGRAFSARIYEMNKSGIDMRVYVTDRDGIVLFDSAGAADEGKDYSRWNDVYRTLRGEYGARATRLDPEDPWSETLYVAAPIHGRGTIVGVLTVCKPSGSVALFAQTAKVQIAIAGALAILAALVSALLVSYWVSRPIEKLTRYAQAVRDGKRAPLPRLGRSEIGALGLAFEEMREALEGKQYVEEYVQTLAHQMKSPLAAVRGAVELLEEDLPPEDRRRFLDNLRSESVRIEDLIGRMLELAALENRRELRDVRDVDIEALLAEIIESLQPSLRRKEIDVVVDCPVPMGVWGEAFLIRQALSNLLQNAVDFSEAGDEISVSLREMPGDAEIRVLDRGAGIPDYAVGKVFERFYSLGRPDTGRKSSGLGLSFVQEVAGLHGGSVRLDNGREGGAVATLRLPLAR